MKHTVTTDGYSFNYGSGEVGTVASEVDEHITKVIFRKDKGGEFKGSVTAFFPEEGYRCDAPHLMMSFQHVGQHGAASIYYYYKDTVSAAPEEYSDLLSELTRMGYNLKVCKRMTRQMIDKRLESLRRQ